MAEYLGFDFEDLQEVTQSNVNNGTPEKMFSEFSNDTIISRMKKKKYNKINILNQSINISINIKMKL